MFSTTQTKKQTNSMKILLHNPVENATPKQRKVHRVPAVISRKVISFRELAGLEHTKMSHREISKLLEVPNSTMQSWEEQNSSGMSEYERFFSTPVGEESIRRILMAVMKSMKCGPSGIRGVQEFLHNSRLDQFVGASEGALQSYWVRCEEYILNFGSSQEIKLAQGMRHRKITAGLDEMFRGRHPCLVAIEVVSNFILLEKFTEDRKAETWKKELEERLEGLDIEIGQVVSDLCGGIRACAKALGAEHIPELFHAQYEISKATAGPLAAQEREFEKALAEDEEKVKKSIAKYGENAPKTQRAIGMRNLSKHGFEVRSKRRHAVRAAKKELGRAHHPINLKTGKLQTAEIIKTRFDEQHKIIEKCADEACLSDSSKKHLEKARRAFDAIVVYLNFFFIVYAAYVSELKLEQEQEEFFNNVIFPLSYLRMIWRRLSRKEKEELKPLLDILETKLQQAPWPTELKNEWMKKGKECAEKFQRSSSCVEGRNGMLSLCHHRFHRLNKRSLKVLTIVHNFDIRRSDGTTAAERFFEQKHENLFESLVANVRIPGRPRQKRSAKELLLAA